MAIDSYLIRECSNPLCEFRFPAPKNSGIGIHCPKCKSETRIVHDLSLKHEEEIGNPLPEIPYIFEVILDNIRSTFNVGSIFRTADGVGVKTLHLCGITPPPTHLKVKKTALGAEKTVNYVSHPNTLSFVKTIKQKECQILALEKTEHSTSIYDWNLSPTHHPTFLIVGNEISGIDPDVLELCDSHLHIPMIGLKNSLNVAIAFSIAAYSLSRNFFQQST